MVFLICTHLPSATYRPIRWHKLTTSIGLPRCHPSSTTSNGYHRRSRKHSPTRPNAILQRRIDADPLCAIKSPYLIRASCRTPASTYRHFRNSCRPNDAATPGPHSPEYTRPETGVLSLLPNAWVPYAELARIDKLAGSVYLFFPCLFSTLMASAYATVPPTTVASTVFLFGTGAVIMRGAGCTVNDLWDRNLDPQVARTRLRPLARQALAPRAAVAFAGAQCLIGLAILLQFPQPTCLYWGVPSLILVLLYPLAKRVTHYPQFVLGLTFSWGALMGFPAVNVDLATDILAAQAAACLYSSCVSWTVLYDMIYAHMDLEDDRRAGIKSIALRHELNTKRVLAGLAAVQIAFLALSGYALDFGPAFFGVSCGGSLCTLSFMIWRVKLQDAASCWWWFKNGAWLTGGTISTGLLLEYLQQERDQISES